jgi:hypothetical protein
MKKSFAGIFITRIFLCLVLCGSVLFSGAKAQQAEKKEERSPDKSTSNLPMAGNQDKAGVFVSREGERHYSEKSTSKPQAGQQDSSGVLISREGERYSSEAQAGNQTQITLPKDQQPLSGDKNKAITPQAEEKLSIEQKVNMEGKKPTGGQPQSSQAGSKKQGKPALKNAVAPKGLRGAGVKR